MNYLIFDMDGVLLDARGYHRALQRTVNLVALQTLSISDIELSREDIHQFEALGISSEWHSSALCLAYLEVQQLSGAETHSLTLDPLFRALKNQSNNLPALQRSLQAIDQICTDKGVELQSVQCWIDDSEDIEKSPTMNWFQEFVLGSEQYQKQYHKTPQLSLTSYLTEYDIPLISEANASRIVHWKKERKFSPAIMTNRPSSGPLDFCGSPEAETGLDLVNLGGLPLIGYGEIEWLANQTGQEPSNLGKPKPVHALAAIFSALGYGKEDSLRISLDMTNWEEAMVSPLQGATITVFEDTPPGIRSVKQAGHKLQQAGVEVTIQAYGITSNPVKKAALESEGAQVAENINLALDSLNNF